MAHSSRFATWAARALAVAIALITIGLLARVFVYGLQAVPASVRPAPVMREVGRPT